MSADVALDEWLAGLGFALPTSMAVARAVLEEAGLTRAGKQRMSEEKLERAEALLQERLFLHCAGVECLAAARASGRTPVPCDPKSTCGRCGGSDNHRAVTTLIEACAVRGIRRIVIVGGSPTVRQELERLVAGAIEVRLVDGTRVRPVEQAKADLAWGHLVLLWGATELHHKVSNQYQDAAQGDQRRRLVHVPKRGIAQLLAGAIEHIHRSRG